MSDDLYNSPVIMEACGNYTIEECLSALNSIAEKSGLGDLSGKKILVKPNILRDAPPEATITTNPIFVRAVLRLLKEHGAGTGSGSLLIGDSPGFQRPGFSGKVCGLGEAAREENVTWVDFSDEKREVTVINGTSRERSFKIAAPAAEADLIINLPKLKTHQLMFFTGAVKNLFGVIPGLGKSPYHVKYSDKEGFARMLADLLSILPPVYTLMDGIVSMEGPGPGNGSPYPLGLVLGGWNPGSVDRIAAQFIGYDPEILPLGRELQRRRLVPTAARVRVIRGEGIPERPQDYKLIPRTGPTNLFRDVFLQKLAPSLAMKLRPRPHFLHDRCIRCGECIKICAAGALDREEPTGEDLSGGKAKWRVRIDPHKCIRCYCCHEICPADAIEIR
jgi:uncharacterized protein (DUF362 family)/Pyruvate/2-oxoacid:ferredoxin oxidoreductase delta subunit